MPVELLLPAEPASDGQQPRPTTIKEDDHDEHEGMDEAALLEHELVTRVKNIKNVSLGKHIMECWYFSPYPEEIWESGPVERLYVCEFTFRYFLTREELVRHMLKPNLHRHPPGKENYQPLSCIVLV